MCVCGEGVQGIWRFLGALFGEGDMCIVCVGEGTELPSALF